ncbi:hypothetical protein Pmar_PMAR017204 [Perkinsus marinus ATCC 50983]|uniref:Uncharacterized protein n=1 Tax=Perkinsus marinus (strain ATCC 50983 / TXsc) TaxID=423536 RepID=C5LSU9_PERM5|nr:hypothetical protein Pmar_PMAR017204 [Perkinsus marinus ATCC 50983]EER00340.1 hypothetical protein Pmar_PMAR017204 [Perkinsus marinus ATCC 50983]|eukprot:XP_002767622.1 hypothetical protein Pmar_PMAR017204 [Perkinsus marinus ATCC 50983]
MDALNCVNTAPIAPGVSMDWQTLMGNLRGRPRCPSSGPSGSPMSSSVASSPYASTGVPSPTPCLPEPSYQFPSGDYQADATANYGLPNAPHSFSKWSIYREAAHRQEGLARLQWERQIQESVRQRLSAAWCGPEQAMPPTYPTSDVVGAAAVAAAVAAMREGKFQPRQPTGWYGPPPPAAPPYGTFPPGLSQYIDELIRVQIDQYMRDYVQAGNMMEQWRADPQAYAAPMTMTRPSPAPYMGSHPGDVDKAVFDAAVAAAAKAINESRGGPSDGSQPTVGGEHFRPAPMQQPRVGSPTPPLLAPMPSRATTTKRELSGNTLFVESMNHLQQQPVKKNDPASATSLGSHPADGVRLAPYVPPDEEACDPGESS